MGRRFFVWVLLALVLVAGAPYAAAVLYRVMGPWSAVGIEQDGSQIHMQFGVDLPRPDFVPVYPGATIVQGSWLTSVKIPSGVGSLDLATRGSFEDVKRFYVERLTASGFAVTDYGTGPLNAPTAAYLGIAGMLLARRSETDDRVDISIGTPEGLIGARGVQLHWRKISETPLMPEMQGQPATN